jgi:hypothetical protein
MVRMNALWPHHSGATQAALLTLSIDSMARLRVSG